VLYAALTAIHFAVPGILLAIGVEGGLAFVHRPNAAYAAEAVLFVWCALIVLQVGGLLVNVRLIELPSSRREKPEIVWRIGAVWAGVAALMLIGIAVRIHVVQSNAYFQIMRTIQGELEGPLYAAIRMAEQFPMYALCILAIVYWRPHGKPSRSLKLGFAFVWLLEVLYWLPTGRKEPVVLALVLPLLIRYLRNRRLPSSRSIGILALTVALWFPASFAYRNAMESTGTEAGGFDTIAAAAELAETGTAGSEGAMGSFLGRIALLEPTSACVRLVREGDWEPMLGISYAQGLLGFVPRLIWPGKPELHYGTEFGHAAGFLSPGDWVTSISVTYYGEAFLNLGWLGLLPMLGIGVMAGLLYRQTLRSPRRETWLLVYASALPVILYVGGTFALTFGGLVKILPFVYVVGWLMDGRVRQSAHSTRFSTIAGRD
jgi:hypothetical protein